MIYTLKSKEMNIMNIFAESVGAVDVAVDGITQNVTQIAQETAQAMSVAELFKLGGVFMWPLLLFSIITVAIVVERIIFYAIHNLKVLDMENDIISKIEVGKIVEAMTHCDTYKKNKLGAGVISKCLKMASLGEHRMEKAIEAAAAEKIKDLEKGFNFLVAIGSLAPITGFLGTVSGMIGAFQSIANAADVNAQLVAGGIFEALITTAFGLIIAIIAIAFYNIFSHIVDKFAGDIEMLGSDLITSVIVNADSAAQD